MDNLGNMPSGVMVAVAALAFGITQYLKFAGIPDKLGPFVVIGIATLVVALWVAGEYLDRGFLGKPLGYVFDVASVTFTAAGVYGFARSMGPSSVTTARKPPAGALDGPTDSL